MTLFNPLTHLVRQIRASNGQRDPARDWLVLLTLSAFAFIGIVVWNVWAFDTVANGGVIGERATSTVPLLNRSSIDTINTIFQKRATEELKYTTGVYRFADPSQ